ncbi:uncharacterized protein LOC100582585 [Nomascus leucogenys]|uniref:uncharacterized protein LOC100582585 n=1 Tax=Nomascus leucogenys TaxID=61853 RepID=UPI00122D52C2|nr:uncharacterized protein LOC100582585 [Nomascus leucogenys]
MPANIPPFSCTDTSSPSRSSAKCSGPRGWDSNVGFPFQWAQAIEPQRPKLESRRAEEHPGPPPCSLSQPGPPGSVGHGRPSSTQGGSASQSDPEPGGQGMTDSARRPALTSAAGCSPALPEVRHQAAGPLWEKGRSASLVVTPGQLWPHPCRLARVWPTVTVTPGEWGSTDPSNAAALETGIWLPLASVASYHSHSFPDSTSALHAKNAVL